MNVIALRALRLFWTEHPRAETPLTALFRLARVAQWSSPADVKEQFGTNVDFVGDNRIIFDIGGNKYRLVVRVSYEFRQVMVKFVGAHEEYDRIDAAAIGGPDQ